jgi:hypothetical protein
LSAAAARLGIAAGSAADALFRAVAQAVAVALEPAEEPPLPIACPWLYDAPASREPDRLFPILGLALFGNTPTAQQMALYDVVGAKPFVYATIAAAQAINPDLIVERIVAPQAYQGWMERLGQMGNGKPFNTTGPVTTDTAMFAGHWLYQSRTLVSEALTAYGVIVSVVNTDGYRVGKYACIYGDGWADAEHVQITAIDTTTRKLTLARGYKSAIVDHPDGSWIAPHQLGNGDTENNWVYNLSTLCPLDGAGRQFNEVFADWIARHYQFDANGRPVPGLRIDGVLFDADFFDFAHGGSRDSRACSIANKDVPDWGRTTGGVNAWGLGLERFYALLRTALPDAFLIGGDAKTFGLVLHGTQLEAFPNSAYADDGLGPINYTNLATYITSAKTQMSIGVLPRMSEAHTKYGLDDDPTSRLSMCLGLMFDCISTRMTSSRPFRWADEYSVVDGHSVDSAEGKRWMGAALGRYARVVDESRFAESMQILPTAQLSPGDYTVCWDSAYAEPSVASVVLCGASSPPLFIAPGAQRNICIITVTRAVAAQPRVTPAAASDIRVFAGNADVFRRDFEQAVVFANATAAPVTIPLDPPLRAIAGADPVNDGQLVESLTLGPYDGRVLCRC